MKFFLVIFLVFTIVAKVFGGGPSFDEPDEEPLFTRPTVQLTRPIKTTTKQGTTTKQASTPAIP
jgi:hypothetical protein